jgi:hypothetical protein
VAELEKLLGYFPKNTKVYAIFAPGSNDPTVHSDLPEKVARLPGVEIVRDVEAQELRRFSFLTSGETRLFSSTGQLVFHGGITASRGHVGDNLGADTVKQLVRGEVLSEQPRTTPVFGCALFNATTPSTL